MSRKGCLAILVALTALIAITWIYGEYAKGIASFQSISVQEPLIFAGVGRRVVVFDVSDPSRPRLVGRSKPLPDDVVDLAVKDEFVLAAAEQGNLQILDVADPTSPQIVSTVEISPHTLAVDVAGDYAFVVDGVNLRVLDVADPTAPRPVSYVTPPTRWPEGSGLAWLDVFEDTAYLLDADQLHVVDVSDPTQTKLISSTPREPDLSAGAVNPDGLRARDDQVILMIPGQGMVILATSDPTKPVVAGRIPEVILDDRGTDFFSGSVATDRAIAFTASSLSPVSNSQIRHLVVFELTDPEHPVQLAIVPIQGDQTSPDWEIELNEDGDRAYMVDGANRLSVWDVSDPTHPASIGHFRLQPTMVWRHQAEP